MDGLAAQGGIACLCLLAVLGLVVGAGRIARHVPGLTPARQAGGPLILLATIGLDRGHRAYLLAAEGQRVLVVAGTGQVALTLLPGQPE